MILMISMLFSCEKEESCQSCKFIGQYSGTFHDVAACYGCIPFRDTMFSGTFLVQSPHGDSISILRLYDKYEWKFAVQENGLYSRGAGTPWRESFTFNSQDSLQYFSNISGGGGYFRLTFKGGK